MSQTPAVAPYFSVVIPLYNKRPYVRRAVDSVLGQSFENFELIVVDDGSTDGGAETLADVVDARFRLVHQENAGEGAARNRGISEARAVWIALLDADDCWLPEHLFETALIIRAFPDSGLVATGFCELSDTSHVEPPKTREFEPPIDRLLPGGLSPNWKSQLVELRTSTRSP